MDQRELIKAEEAKKIQAKLGRMTVLLLEPVSFSGIDKRKLAITECTLKTAQPDGKHLVKKPVANVFKRTHERRNANNFAVGLRRKKLSKIEKSIL